MSKGEDMAEEQIGTITHYYGNIGVAGIHLDSDALRVGDTIHVQGHTSDFTQSVDSIQLDHESVEEATVGQDVGVRVVEHAREHDKVFKVME